MVVQIIADHLLCQGHSQALAIQAVPALRRLTAYIGGSANVLRKGPENKCCQLWGPSSLCRTYSAPLWRQESRYRQDANELMWLCPSTHGWRGPAGCRLLSPGLTKSCFSNYGLWTGSISVTWALVCYPRLANPESAFFT